MCSSAGSREPSAADTAAAVAEAVDDLAAAIKAGDVTGPELAAQLAGAWEMITAADPVLAARMARYSPTAAGSGRPGGRTPTFPPSGP